MKFSKISTPLRRRALWPGAVTLTTLSVLGGGSADAQSYGLGGNYTFKPAPSISPASPPPLYMPRNSLGATPPLSIPLRDLRPVSPPFPPPPYVPPSPPPKTAPYIAPSSNPTAPLRIGIEHELNPTTKIRPGVDVAPNLPPRTDPPKIDGGSVVIEKQIK
jgi:hypothetical protein